MIHILIERFISNGMDSTYDELARTALQRTYSAPGFISGEAFTDANNKSHRLIFGKWKTFKDWKHWLESHERLEVTNQLSSILEQPEKITVLKN